MPPCEVIPVFVSADITDKLFYTHHITRIPYEVLRITRAVSEPSYI